VIFENETSWLFRMGSELGITFESGITFDPGIAFDTGTVVTLTQIMMIVVYMKMLMSCTSGVRLRDVNYPTSHGETSVPRHAPGRRHSHIGYRWGDRCLWTATVPTNILEIRSRRYPLPHLAGGSLCIHTSKFIEWFLTGGGGGSCP
jgi:hypothetical protein